VHHSCHRVASPSKTERNVAPLNFCSVLSLAEDEIYLLRLQELHHLPSDTTIPKITDKLKDINILMNPSQISNNLEHIYS
jgi:hypothetical protein